MQDPSLPQLALTILGIDFLRYALAAGAVWLLVEVLLGRRLAGRRRALGCGGWCLAPGGWPQHPAPSG